MGLELSLEELGKTLDSDSYRQARLKQYGEGVKSELGLKVVYREYQLRAEDVADLYLDGAAMWSFIDTVVIETGALQQQQLSDSRLEPLLSRETAERIVDALGSLPEGPFFYALRVMYNDSRKIESAAYSKDASRKSKCTHGFAHFVRSMFRRDADIATPNLSAAFQRLSSLSNTLENIARGTVNYPKDFSNDGNTVDRIGIVFQDGNIDWFVGRSPENRVPFIR